MRWSKVKKVKEVEQGNEEEANLLKPGIHYCKVVDVKEKITKDSKMDMWNVYFADMYTEDLISLDRFVFSESAQEFVEIKLEMLGFRPDEHGFFDVDPRELYGRKIILELEINNFNGSLSLVPNFKSKKEGHGYWPVTEANLKLVTMPDDDPPKVKDLPKAKDLPEESDHNPAAFKPASKEEKDDIPY